LRYLPHTATDISQMLATVGVESVDELLEQVPANLRAQQALGLPDGCPEAEVLERAGELAANNSILPSFQGAGCYRRHIPSVVSAVLSRAEFATAYTPYQPEVSQGTLQACFEFQTYVARLCGLDVANASLYDGASALAEAVLLAVRVGRGRRRVLMSAGVHPAYRAVTETYLRGSGDSEVELIGVDENGRTDAELLEKALGDDVAAICTGYPNFYGVIDDLATASRLARRCGALSLSVTSEPLALGLLRSPGELGADVAVAEGQGLGLPLSYGGPGVGLFAARQQYLRQVPGRLVGETRDSNGRRGYVLTLATREQHIRRERATSNICTNQGLAALAVTTFLGVAGRNGLRKLAALNTVRAHQLADRLASEAGLAPVFSAPFFNEFAIEVPDSKRWFDDCVQRGVIPGVRVADLEDSCADGGDNRVLVTVTEVNSDADFDLLVSTARQSIAA